MNRIHTTIALILSISPLFLACFSSDERACASQSDCYKDQVCVQEICAQAVATQDMFTTDKDMTTDMNGMVDMSKDMPPPVCVVDRFSTMCVDVAEAERSNNTKATATRLLDERIGCNKINESPNLPRTMPDVGVLCPLESADFYSVGYTACKAQHLFITAKLQPNQMCGDGLVTLNTFKGGVEMDCTDEYLTCSTMPDGTLVRTVEIPVGQQINTLYFSTDGAGRFDVMYDYSLTISSTSEEVP